MAVIHKGDSARFTVTVRDNGSVVSIQPDDAVSARLFLLDGVNELIGSTSCDPDAVGANWAEGVVAVEFSASETDGLDAGDAMLVLSGSFGRKRYRVRVEADDAPERSLLFVRDFIIEEIRADGLMSMAQGLSGGVAKSDDYIWQRILAAEASIARELRVPLVPTRFFPGTPTQAQIDALDGMAWAEDPGYDYHQDMFFPDKWGMIKLKNKPLIEIHDVSFDFPTMGDSFFKMPTEWLREFKKYGHIQFVPSTPALFSTAGTFVMRALTGYSVVPMMVKITYTAGLTDAAKTYPDLIDAIKKRAIVKAIEDAMPAQSGSISADGLSQSVSVDMAKYSEVVDLILHGAPGTNGGLMTAIHGVRSIVMGGN